MVIVSEISKEVHNQRLAELDLYKQNVLATFTHDLKTPLNGVISILDALDGCNDTN